MDSVSANDDKGDRQTILKNAINSVPDLSDFEHLAGDIKAGTYTLDGGSDIEYKKTGNSLKWM